MQHHPRVKERKKRPLFCWSATVQQRPPPIGGKPRWRGGRKQHGVLRERKWGARVPCRPSEGHKAHTSAHARTLQNHTGHHGGVPGARQGSIVAALSSRRRGFPWQQGSCDGGKGGRHLASPRLLMVVPGLHVVVARRHRHLLVVFHGLGSF